VNPVSFLLIAVVVAVVGSLLVVGLNRKPHRPDSAMAEFEREMRALAPRPPSGTPTRRPPVDDGDTRPEPGPDES
jgi:hypothetical protein